MDAGGYVTLGVGIAILAFLWSLHRDMRSLGERVARLEGAIGTLKDVLIKGDRRYE